VVIRSVMVMTFAVGACLLSSPAASPTQSTVVAITDVTLIDGTGASPRSNVTVLLSGDRIARIGLERDVRVPSGAITLDGHGKFLIPGLWDMHVHLGNYDDGTKTLRRLAANGITGVRDMASPIDDILRLRRDVAEGRLIGPIIVAAGPILQRPLLFALPPLVRSVTDAEAVKTVDDLRGRGVDFIKVGDTLTRGAYFAIAAEARRLRLPFGGHLPIEVSALEAARAGQRSVEHFGSAGMRNLLIACSTDEAALGGYVREAMARVYAGGPLPDEALNRAEFLTRMVETYDRRKAATLFRTFVRSGMWQVPTFVALERVWAERRPSLAAADAAAAERAANKTREMFVDMKRAGVKVMAGSDLPLPPASAALPLHDELVALVRAGLTSAEALEAATRAPAEFLGRLSTDGTIEIGKRANVVLLAGNPLEDIANTRRVAAVILRGRPLMAAE
jgi:amidohydrolase family protein